MKISIKLEYKDKVYTSDYLEVNEEEKKEIIELLQSVIEGKSTYLTLIRYNEEYFFSKKIIEDSIITIITKHTI